MSSSTSSRVAGTSIGGQLFSSILGFVVCVLLPAFMTLAAPLAYTTLRYDGETVTAQTTHIAYLLIPYANDTIADVQSVEADVINYARERDRINGERRWVRPESNGSLLIQGAERDLLLYVSPASLDDVQDQVETFLANPSREPQSFFTVANWKVGFFFAIPMVLLTVLYVVGSGIAIGQWVIRLIRR